MKQKKSQNNDKLYNDKFNPPDTYIDRDGNTKNFTYINHSKGKSFGFVNLKESSFNTKMEYMNDLVDKNNLRDEFNIHLLDKGMDYISFGVIKDFLISKNIENNIICHF